MDLQIAFQIGKISLHRNTTQLGIKTENTHKLVNFSSRAAPNQIGTCVTLNAIQSLKHKHHKTQSWSYCMQHQFNFQLGSLITL